MTPADSGSTRLPLTETEKQLIALDNQLCFQLYAASRAITRQYQPGLKALDLTYPQYLVMLALWQSDASMTVSELGHRLQLDSGTLTPLLKRLEQKQLIRRQRASADERLVEVHLQQAGITLSTKAPELAGQMLCGLDNAQIASLVSLREQLKALQTLLQSKRS